MLMAVARGLAAACLLLLFQTPRAVIDRPYSSAVIDRTYSSVRFDGARNLFLLENWTDAATLPPERYADVFSISVDAPDVPAMLGEYRLEGSSLVFKPQFPLQPGVRYRAVARIPGLAPISATVD